VAMKVLVLPRAPSPYQNELYAAMRRQGTRVSYLGVLTSSRTLNLLLLPFETLVRAATGWRIVHVHWLFGFALPGSERFPLLRRLSQAWFMFWLAITQSARVRIVWTAHNVLPHERVFHDDLAARRALVRASRLVIAHSTATLGALDSLGLRPCATLVVPHGPIAMGIRGASRQPGSTPGQRRLLFFGQVREYKGVEELVAAATQVPATTQFTLLVAGECGDAALRQRLERLAALAPNRVILDLRYMSDTHLAHLVDDADIVALPFRRVTTSGSAWLALNRGRPLILPRLPAFDEFPDDAVWRYDGTIGGLTAAITAMAEASPERLATMSDVGRAHLFPSWDAIARRTLSAFEHAKRRP